MVEMMVADVALMVKSWLGMGCAHSQIICMWRTVFGEERWGQAGVWTFSHRFGLLVSQGLLSAGPRAAPGKRIKPFLSKVLALLVISNPVGRLVSRGDGIWEVPSAVTFPISCS